MFSIRARRFSSPALCCLGLSLLLGWSASAVAKTKIAAIGASTTRGSGAPAGQSYPDQLQRLLGPEFEVRNFGKNGAGALRKGNPTYWNSPEHKAASDYGPDIVINWLGGADSKAASWDAHKGEFLADYKAMIKHFQDLPSHPKIISMMSIALYNDAGVRKDILEAEVNPLQRQGAEESGSRFINTKAIVDGHPEYFADGVHLKANGYAAIAMAVYNEVLALGPVTGGGTDAGSDGGSSSTDGQADERGSVPTDAGASAVADSAGAEAASTTAEMDAGKSPPPRDAAGAPTTMPGGQTGSGNRASTSGCAMSPSGQLPAPLVVALIAAATLCVRRRRSVHGARGHQAG